MFDHMSRHMLLVLFHCFYAYWRHLFSSYITFRLFMKFLCFLRLCSLFVLN